MDNMLFSNMTLNPQPLHIDAHFCATETEWDGHSSIPSSLSV